MKRGPRGSSLPTRRAVALGLVLSGLLVTLPGRSWAAPVAAEFGPAIEDYADYDGMSKCKPKAKPGSLAIQTMLQTAYPDSTWFGISRGCKIGGDSEHKEGRAIDWSRDATNPAERATVKDLLDWLFAEDEFGNEHAMARRLGIMYVIWNRRMWSAWDQGWEVFCVQKGKRCKDPDSKSVVHPHTDHVHFSLGWDGAKMKTSFWNPELSFADPVEVDPLV